MKVSELMLRERVEPTESLQQVGEALTFAGIEQEGIEPVAVSISKVVVAQVKAVVKHPNADKLNLCEVDVGDEAPLSIVCGASNVRPGLKVACALVGAKLGDFKIKKSKIRGELSFGMLCSESELGLSAQSSGIMELAEDAPLGQCFVAYMQLNDQVLDVSITPNRGDCVSVLGVAREVALLMKTPLLVMNQPHVQSGGEAGLKVHLHAPERGCPRYLGRVIDGVDVSRSTPLWMQERLRRSDIHRVSLIVDIANYVMLELGQPLHAFDADTLQGDVHVRFAKVGESLSLLNGDQLALDAESLVIADDVAPQALAGVMGGQASAVSLDTKRIFIESAFFHPEVIARCVRQKGIHSDASYRYERGVDYELPALAMARMTELVLRYAGGEASELVEACVPEALPVREPISLRASQIQRVLGFSMAQERVEDILAMLDLSVSRVDGGWTVIAPSYRFDLKLEVDLIEELVRVFGFNQVPLTLPTLTASPQAAIEAQISIYAPMDLLCARAYREVICYSFVNEAYQATLCAEQAVRLQNPMSQDMAVMRTSLLPGLLSTVQNNQHRQQMRLKLFEQGLCFVQEQEGYGQARHLAAVSTGAALPEQWGAESRPLDFFDIKADLMSVLQVMGVAPMVEFYSSGDHPALHPGQAAKIQVGEAHVGWIGALHPEPIRALDLKGPVFMFELFLDNIPRSQKPAYIKPSKFPELRRDLAFYVDSQDIVASVNALGLSLLKDVRLFDVYQGEHLPAGKKSMAIALILQHIERTLVDEEVVDTVNQVIDLLKQTFSAQLRD
jgi:phenylalanyl-tRNA synthetase beta chain